jgi:pimeloyl-ACP methyl ester carboxylesterase
VTVRLGTIDVAGGMIEVHDRPASPTGTDLRPLVLLHEGLGSAGLWRDVPDVLARRTGRRVVAWSRHGHGRSAPPPVVRGVDHMHHEATVVLPEVVRRMGLRDPVLVGHSDGASIALINAGTGAGAPPALVCLAPHVIVEDRTIVGITAAAEAAVTTDLLQRMDRHHDDAPVLFTSWRDRWLSPSFRSWDVTDVLAGITCPVLLVQGLDDEYGTLRQLDLIQAGVAGPVQRVELAACRHSPHLQQPAATLDAITSFLDGDP